MTPSSHPAAWEPLVYGRTGEVDFCYLGVPGSLGPDDLAWAKGFVKGARLSTIAAWRNRTVRLCLFKGRGRCGLGASMPAGLLYDDRMEAGDAAGREIYVFLGGVAPCDASLFPEPPHHPPIPGLDALRANLRPVFGPMYDEFVVGRYRERPLPGHGGELLAVRTAPRAWFPNGLASAYPESRPFGLDPDDDEWVRAWPPALEEELWSAACLAGPPISLCLNVTREADARASTFGNVTLENAGVRSSLLRGGATPAAVGKARIGEAEPPPPGPGPGGRHELVLRWKVFGRTVIDINSSGSRPGREGLEVRPHGRGQGTR